MVDVTQLVEPETQNADVVKMLEDLPVGHPRKHIEESAQELTAIKAFLYPEENIGNLHQQSLQELELNDETETFKIYQTQYNQKVVSALTAEEMTQYHLSEEIPETAKARAVGNIKSFQELREEYTTEAGRAKVLVDAYSNNLDEELDDNLKVKHYAFNNMQKLAKDRGTYDLFDKVLNYSSLLVADFTKDISDLTGAAFDSASAFKRDIERFNSQSAAEKEAEVPELTEKLLNAFDNNPVKATMALSLYFDPNYESEINFSETLDAIDYGALISYPVNAGIRVANAVRFIPKLRDMKANQEITELNAIIAKSMKEGVTDADTVVAQGAARDPLSTGKTIVDGDNPNPGNVGAQTAADEAIDAVTMQFQEKAAEVIKKEFDKEDIFGELDRRLRFDNLSEATGKAIKQTGQDQLTKGRELTGARLLETDGDTFVLQFEAREIGGSHTIKTTSKFKYTPEAGGGLLISEVGDSASFVNNFGKLLSPETLLKGLTENVVVKMTQAGRQQARISTKLASVWKDIEHGMSKDSIRSVDSLLMQGDHAGKVYTVPELQAGVMTATGKKVLSTKEINMYYKKREYYDKLWSLRNTTARDSMVAQGFVEANVAGVPTIVRRVDVDKVKLNNELVFFPQSQGKGKHARLGSIDNFEVDDLKVVELYSPYTMRHGNTDTTVKYMAIRETGKKATDSTDAAFFRDLPFVVLNKPKGYIPRHRRPGLFYVKDMSTVGNKTVRIFDGRKAAEEYAAANRTADSNLQAWADGALNDVRRREEEFNDIGGLYTSPRSSTPIAYGKEGEEFLDRVSVAEATGNYVNNIAKAVSLTEYRLGLIDRFKKSVNHIARTGKESKESGFKTADDWTSPLTIEKDWQGNKNTIQLMEQTREYMKRMLMQETKEESMYSNFMDNLVDFMEGKKIVGGSVRRVTQNLRDKDPIKSLRGLTFNAHLGWFNVRQLWVQAQNASLAMSMHPILGSKAAIDSIPQMAIMWFDKTGHSAKDMALALKKIGVSDVKVDDVAEVVDLFKRSGLRDSVMHTADFDVAITNGLGHTTMNTIRKAAKAGRTFYEQGETYSRLIAFNIALAKHKAKNPGKAISDVDLEDISNETMRMHMNLQKENPAWWQTNAITAIPTQFMQVQAKFLENVAKGLFKTKGATWTRKESASVLAGQLALYGTVGVPLAEETVNVLAEKLGVTSEVVMQEYPLLVETINEGLTGFVGSLFGGDFNASESGSLLAGFDDTVVAKVIEQALEFNNPYRDKADIIDTGFGPSGNTWYRAGDGLMRIYSAAAQLVAHPSLEELEFAGLEAADSIAGMTSTWSNAKKAYHLMTEMEVLSRSGRVKLGKNDLDIEDTELFNILAKGMGFPLDMETALRQAQKYNKSMGNDEKQTIDAVINNLRLGIKGNNVQVIARRNARLLAPYTAVEQRRIMDSAMNHVFTDESKYAREVRRLVSNYVSSQGRHTVPYTGLGEGK